MTPLAKGINALWPTLNFADVDGNLANVRYDEPLPESFTPPTQAQIDEALYRLSIPASVSAGDFMRALIELGWYDSVVSTIENLRSTNTDQGKLAGVLWDRATKFLRNDPLLIQVGTLAGRSSADLDAIFVKAASYE